MYSLRALKQDFSEAASAYDEYAQLQREVRQQCIRRARTCWEDTAHILDAGCGTGALAEDIRHYRLRWRITGLDLAFGMCAFARQREGRVVNANAESIPFANASFDGVFSSLMLQWAGNPLAMLRDMGRVVRPGGQLVVATLIDGTLHELRESFAATGEEPGVSQFPDKPALGHYVEQAGFRLIAGEESSIVEHYPDSMALMRSLRSIGAADKRVSRRKGLMTPYRLRQIERMYKHRFGNAQGLPASWRVYYMTIEKP